MTDAGEQGTPEGHGGPDVAELIQGLRARNRRAIARALTEVERQSRTSRSLLSALQGHLGRSIVAGVTGPPGSGKSTLINACVRELRRQGRTVAVLAVDPTSPISGGAILGDRVRMTSALDDDGVFVRSLASRGHLGGVSPAAVRMIDILDAAGFDVILVETVGTGQSEIDIAEVTDVRVVVSAPGLGDEIQAMKSGLLEIADVLVVNKGDREGADRTLHQLKSLRSRGPESPPVLKTTALTGEGVGDLVAALGSIGSRRLALGTQTRRRMRARYLIARAAAELVEAQVRQADSAHLDALCDALLAGDLSAAEAARGLTCRDTPGQGR